MAKQPAPSKEVATQQPAGAVALPDYMKGYEQAGKQDIGRDAFDIPRLKLIQGSSAELETYNVRPGQFFHTGSERVFDKEGTRIVPILYEQRFILWRPMESGGGILARADDGVHWSPANATFDVKLKNGTEVKWRTKNTVAESGLDVFGSADPSDNKSPPAATRMLNYLVGFPDFPEEPFAVLTFKGRSIKYGRKFGTTIKLARGPMQGLVFNLTSAAETNGAAQKFFVIQRPTPAGTLGASDEGLFREYMGAYESLRGQALKINVEDEAREAEALGTEEPEETVPAGGRASPRY